MEHTESKVKVYSTKEYSRFRFIEGNRALNQTKIDKIIDDINSGTDVLKYYPITVCEYEGLLWVEDGQHRFWISRRLQKPVYYIIMEGTLKLAEIAKVNSNVEKWKASDFINCYKVLNNKNYEILDEFMAKYSLSVTLAVQLLREGFPSVRGFEDHDSFQRGSFEVKEYEKAVEFADVVSMFKAFKSWKSRYFFVAIYKIMKQKKVKMKDLADKVNKHIDKLTAHEGWKQYIENLESVYNFKRNERIIIYTSEDDK